MSANNPNGRTRQASQSFPRIFIVQLENRAYELVIQNSYFASLASRGLLLTSSYGVTHPSQPNYIAQIGGDLFLTDNNSHDLPQTNLVDLLESKGVPWKTYQENYPGNCFAGGSSGGLYVRRHNPFISFDNIRTNPARCAKIVNASQLDTDIAANVLPQFSYYTPNLDNDSHDTSIAFAATWLQSFLEPKLTNPNFISGTLVVITFDEDDDNHNNHVYTLLLASPLTPGTDAARYDHYSLLRTVEDNFNLGNLGRKDASATGFSFSSQPGAPTATPTRTRTPGPNPTATNTRTPGPSPTATRTRTPGPSPTATRTRTPGPTPTPRPTSVDGNYPAYLPLVLQSYASTPSDPPTATPTSPAQATSTTTPNATPTAGPTATQTKTPTVTPTSDSSNVQPVFPVRAAFYYPWFPEAWQQSGIYPYTEYTPSLGYYNQSDTSVILNHLSAMQYGNIQAGIASWWGIGEHTDVHFAQILTTTTANNSPFRWGLYYEKESTGNPTVAEIQSDLTYIKDHYGQDRSYWRVNGRFVVFVYADATDGCDMTDRWHQANANINAYIVLKVFANYTACPNQPDEWHQYAPAAATSQQGTHSFAISPGFWLKGNTVRLARDLDRWKGDIRSMVASGAQLQLVTTFNEWGEGTSVESAQQWSSPSGYGDYLDALHTNGLP